MASSSLSIVYTAPCNVKREIFFSNNHPLKSNRLFNTRVKPFYALKCRASADTEIKTTHSKNEKGLGFSGLHHVGILCKDLQKSLDFYCGILGLEVNEARDDARLSFGGTWLWLGSDMIHLMELPNPDPTSDRPAYVGRDRHTCIKVDSVSELKNILDKAGIEYSMSKSGRPALFTRDPDGNGLEFVEN